LLTVLLAVRRPPAPRWVGELLRWAAFMQPWSMVEVMILGILIALIKIAELALVDPGIGMYAVGALVVLLTAIGITFEPDEIWRRIEWVDPQPSVAGGAEGDARPRAAGRACLVRGLRAPVPTSRRDRAGPLPTLRHGAGAAPS